MRQSECFLFTSFAHAYVFREYHNIVTWDYGDLLKVLTSVKVASPTQTYRVTKETELGELLDSGNLRDKGCLQLVEIVVGRDDAPPALRRALKIEDPSNKSNRSNRTSNAARRARLPPGFLGW